MKKQIRELYSNETSSDHSPNSSNSSSRDGKSYDLYVEHIIKLIKTIWIKDVSDWMVCKDEIKFDIKTYSKSQIQFQQPYINNNNNNNNNDDDDINNNNDDNINNPKISSHSAVYLSIGEYYERIVKGKVMKKLLAIAGIRIAAVLNTLFS
ncbi:hypothetical protein Glove_166g254 [Diversispora epigaea]|uniref:Uncharacterized protein n=1 Tax=Diversispora epigaea TaxID=1348612 RepID=A0A397IWV1_9GLOM|nr:hypothetical protein Glove_166g254 [Diversispora epigaea]